MSHAELRIDIEQPIGMPDGVMHNSMATMADPGNQNLDFDVRHDTQLFHDPSMEETMNPAKKLNARSRGLISAKTRNMPDLTGDCKPRAADGPGMTPSPVPAGLISHSSFEEDADDPHCVKIPDKMVKESQKSK